MINALNTILSKEAEAALDATWESGSFAGHRFVDVQEHGFALNWMLECATEKGHTDAIEYLTERLAKVNAFLDRQ